MRSTITILLIGLLTLTACSPGRLITSLNIVADAASVAVVTVTALPPQVLNDQKKQEIVKYAQAVAEAADKSAVELGTKDSTAVKVSNITGYFGNVAALEPNLSGITGEALAVVRAVAAGVDLFLKQLPRQSLTAAGPAPEFTLTRGDKQALSRIRATNRDTLAHH